MKKGTLLFQLMLFIGFIFIYGCSSKEETEKKQVKSFTGNLEKDLHNLLPKGKFTVHIWDSIVTTPRQLELTLKFREGIRKNQQWFAQYTATIPPGEPMPYHPNIGLSKLEYDELFYFLNNAIIIPSGTEKVEIIYEGDFIKFKSSKKLEILNTIKINTKSKTVEFLHILDFKDSTINKESTPMFKSPTSSYNWEHTEPKEMTLDHTMNMHDFSGHDYRFSIGFIKMTKKTFIRLDALEVDKGNKVLDFRTTIVF